MFIQVLRLVVKTFFREVTVKGIDNLPESGPVIFTPNHPNALIDPVLLFFFSPDFKIRFVAKAPLFKIPLLGWIMRKMQAIPVVRRYEAEGKVDYKAFFAACVDSLAAGNSITIFPEGISLPQPYMADMRTGAARLFFMARERNVDVKIVPVGLNYEHGSTFRSSVVVWAAPPVDTTDIEQSYKVSPQSAVRDLTDKIKTSLENHVFQTESYRDRELMLLLEKIYNKDETNESWSRSFERLKQFESGLKELKDTYADDIGKLRQMLSKYEQLTSSLDRFRHPPAGRRQGSFGRFFFVIAGFPIASIGWLLNVLPYQLCNLIVKHIKKYDEAAAATYKISYSFLLFPLAFVLEAVLVYVCFGWIVTVVFSILVIPISYFTLRFYEWIEKGGLGIPIFSVKLNNTLSDRIFKQREMLRSHISDIVDNLASYLDKQSD